MKTLNFASLRSTSLILCALAICAALSGCGSAPPAAPPAPSAVSVTADPLPAPALPASRTLDAYKADVARHIMHRNPERIFDGRLPPMLPAIVVLNITVDDQGQLTDVQVQRSRDPGASEVALASLRRSGPLPRPDGLMPRGAAMTFTETFLFGEQYRYQIRSLAGPQ